MEPGTVPSLPNSKKAPWPVPLWPHPNPGFYNALSEPRSEDAEPKQGENGKENPKTEQDSHKRRAERVETPEENRGLILHRFESIFSWAEFIKVDRAMDEEEEPEKSKITADDMDVMSMARDNKPMAKRIRFDLDLPSEADDDLVLPGEKLLPEWDYKKNRLIPDYCLLIPMLSRDLHSCELPSHLSVTASKIRAEFSQLMPGRVWFRRQPDGAELDLEAVGEARADRLLKRGIAQPPIFVTIQLFRSA